VFASFDDVTIRLTAISWTAWDMAVLDAQALGGRLGGTPGYLLPLDWRGCSQFGCWGNRFTLTTITGEMAIFQHL